MMCEAEFHLEAASGAVVADDADVRWIEACAHKPIQVVMRELFHHTQLLLNRSSHLSVHRMK